MVRLIAIDAVCASTMVVLWYLLFSRYNRRKGTLVLRWVEAACATRGRVVDMKWLSTSRLQVHLSFAAHWFENARVTIKLLPRPIPIQWILCLWRRQRETVTFEADLDDTPTFHLEITRHRWLTQKPKEVTNPARNWTLSRPGPVVLTTRTEWTHELTPVVNTLMTSRGHNLLTVRFRPDSPHLAATIPLEALSDEQTTAAFLSVLKDLAAGSSASRH
ncbi:MAG: hypothetical protein QOG55_3858 [Acidobacteriaceae bacterium]|nr:hypothetical protein [Acidobacteriaceae bacterium]